VHSDEQPDLATDDPIARLDRPWADSADLGATAPIDPVALGDDDELDVPEFLR